MKRYVSCLLALLLIFSGIAGIYKPVQAAEKKEKTRSIAIVYDNSGSMIGEGDGKAWCQALYAMEVFASMMNERDSIRIYPMWEIKVNEESFTHAHPHHPLEINSPQDARLIRDIVSPNLKGTPIGTIESAYKGLLEMSGEDKWLIVLTDGTDFDDYQWNEEEEKWEHATRWDAGDQANQQLSSMIAPYVKNVNVIFLGIGKDAAQPVISPENDHQAVVSKADQSQDVLTELTNMCNIVYGRDAMEITGNSVPFKDLSMKQLFVFVQGDEISNVTLTDSDGNTPGTKGEEITTHYNEHNKSKSSYKNEDGSDLDGTIDKSLQGVIQKYKDCPAGSYILDFSGTKSSIGVYYEPDVDLVVRLLDAAGNDVTSQTEVEPGEYQLEYGLIDNQTQQITSSDLLGDTYYKITYTINGEQQEFERNDKTGTIPITINDSQNFSLDQVYFKYLSGYEDTKTGFELGFPEFGIQGVDPGPDPAGDFELAVSGGASEYKLSALEQGEPFQVEFIYNGEKLKADQIEEFSVQSNNEGIAFQWEPDGDHYNVTVHYADPEHPENINCDDLIVGAIQAKYTEPEHETATANAAVNFQLNNDITGLSATLVNNKTRFTLAELDGHTMNVDLKMGGEPLTDQQMNDLNVTVTIEDAKGNSVPCTTEKDPSNSRVTLTLGKEGVKKGDYTVKVTATTKDQVGKETTDSDETKIKVRLLPVWIILLEIFVVLALIAALLWFILSRKVLPKTILAIDTRYMISGTHINGNATTNFKGARQKKGTLQITPPRAPRYPMARANFTIHLEATDTVYKVLKKKITKRGNLSALCTGIDSNTNVNRVMISGTAFNWDSKHRLQLPPGETIMPRFRIGNEEMVIMNATAMDPTGNIGMNMTCTLVFK